METKHVPVLCPVCGAQYEILTYSGINTASSPELKAMVKDGSLFVSECPSCGKHHLHSFQTLYHDPGQKLMLWLIPGSEVSDSQVDALSSQLSALEDYTLRRVDNAGSLVEKVNIFDAGLDDVAIELCKYVTRQELLSEGDPAAASKVPDCSAFRFNGTGGADHELTMTFPQGEHMMSVQVGFNVYEDCTSILRRNPSVRPPRGFARVDAAWLSTHLR